MPWRRRACRPSEESRVSSSRIARPRDERIAKARLLEPQRFDDQRLGAHEFRIGLPHFAHQHRNEPPHQRLARAEKLGVAHGAAHDPAQHIAAAFVRRQNAIGDEKGGGAQMIGDDAMARLLRAVGIDAGGARRRRESGRASDRCRNSTARPAAARRCARGPCRCRSRGAAERRARPARSAHIA